MKCDSCMNSRTVVSENGFHPICCLPDIDIKECLKSGKHYVQHPKFKISKEEHRMTNAEHIRSMTDEELVEFINMVWGNGRAARHPSNGWAEWLKEEVEDDTRIQA